MSAKKKAEVIHLLQPPRRARGKLATAVFNAGEVIPATAVYAVAHAHHPLPLQVTLRRGCSFPACEACHELVEFRFLRNVDRDSANRFQVRLNVLPVLEPSAEEELLPPQRLALAG
jgi:excinuclease UvrABC helicase subunit UvrB